MQLSEVKRNKKFFDVVQPNTKRVLEQRMKRMEQQKKKKQQKQKEFKALEEQRKKKQNYLMQKQKYEAYLQTMRKQEENRRIQQMNVSNKLSGRFGHMINNLKTNTSNLQFTISGLDLRPAQIKVLVNNVQSNSSLKALSMIRKKLSDSQGKDISEKLECNKVLERLQLEGNKFGPKTLQALAKLLKTNKTIRSIDLEGNPLIQVQKQQKKSYDGIEAMARVLQGGQQEGNQTLLCLNLNNCELDQRCSNRLKQIFKQNKTLILMSIQNNPKMKLQDVQQIQQALKENKMKYDDQRYKQFIERKRMKRQEDISAVLMLNEQTKKLREQTIEANTVAKKAQFKQQWEEFVKNQEIMRQKMIAKLQKESKMKKKKRRKPAKKK